MSAFEEGYAFFEKQTGVQYAGYAGGVYVDQIDMEIAKLLRDLNAFEGFKTKPDALKGDIAEFWHADTFNINAVARDTANRTFVDRSHGFASADISSNFEELFGLKYYKTGVDSAKQQAKSVFERFHEYRSAGGKDALDTFLEKRGYADDSVLHDPIYYGQIRVIPKDQLETACEWLRRKIATESAIRPEQVGRYRDTLKMLSDRLMDGQGTESIPLSEADAKALAVLAKKGDVSAEKLKILGISADEVIRFEYLAKQAFKSGLTAATISVVLNVAPEIYKAINHLIKSGDLDENQFQRIGFSALKGGSEGFIRGTVSAAITIACKSGMLGEALKSVSPSVVGMATVLAMDTMRNAFKVAAGKMTRSALAQELVKELMVSSAALAGGTIAQIFIEIPVMGFMIGSFIGSTIGSFAYNCGYSAVMSFCVDTGFTMFGLVKQDYTLPEDVLEYIGVNVFQYEKFLPKQFQKLDFTPNSFNQKEFEANALGIRFLRRGVIGVSEIGYV
jgi:uncharacterized protein YqgC (DUF456 family)